MSKIRKLFCRHKYNKISYYEEYDKYRNIRYSVRFYKCEKCGQLHKNIIATDDNFDKIIELSKNIKF